MIHTLTLNPSLDYIAECPHFTLSATNRTTGETIYPGGKGINVSLVLKNLGYSSIPMDSSPDLQDRRLFPCWNRPVCRQT